MQNTGDNVFERSLYELIEGTLERFFDSKDYAESSRRTIRTDLLRFGRWYIQANNEPLDWSRVVTRDIADFREHMVRVEERSISTTNRNLVFVRQVFAWLVHDGQISSSPAKNIKELRRQPLAPKGLSRSEARKLLREAEARQDYRAIALFHVMLYCGVRVSELVGIKFSDMELGERTGWVKIFGKGNKLRMIPVPLPARRALADYFERRPSFDTDYVFVGERGVLTDRGVRNICRRYSAITGIHIHPHLLRHSYAQRFLQESQDLISLACLLGHSSLESTRVYVQRQQSELASMSDRMTF